MLDIGIKRSQRNRWIRGVCGGLGEYFKVNALWVRLGFVVLALIIPGVSTISVIALYVLLGILLPEADRLP